jgi:phenylacetate-coenzyme A ligase PaaK-like adenylate-forming protein
MRDNYPYGLFAVPLEQIVRIHASSGTTGKPTVVGYTRRDIDMWAELMARSFVAAGVTRAMSSTTPTATASLPAALAPTTALRSSVPRSSPCPAGNTKNRS